MICRIDIPPYKGQRKKWKYLKEAMDTRIKGNYYAELRTH